MLLWKEKNIHKIIFGFLFFSLFLFFFIYYFQFVKAEDFECKDYSDRILKPDEYDKVIEACDKEINSDRQKLQEKNKQTSGVRSEIANLNYKIKISHAFINRKIALANKLKKDIGENRNDIEQLNTDISETKQSLKSLLFQLNTLETNTTLEAFLVSDSLSDFFIEQQVSKVLFETAAEQIKKNKKEKKELEQLMLDLSERELLERQLAQEKQIESEKIQRNKTYKNELLNILKNEEGAIKNTILSKEKTKQTILRRKFTLASGEKISFGDAYHIIRPFKKQLGMDPAFILAILFQESGHRGKIGGNIGRCTYNQANKHGRAKNGYMVMSNTQIPAFKKIMNDLGRDPKVQKISCPIPRDGAYGGAMGPAQFMPTTWLSVRKRVGGLLGKSAEKVSPFLNSDSFLASGIYLRDQYYSKSCSAYAKKYAHISPEYILRERCAASRYYAGGAWFRYRMTYGQQVVNRANRFRADIRILNE